MLETQKHTVVRKINESSFYPHTYTSEKEGINSEIRIAEDEQRRYGIILNSKNCENVLVEFEYDNIVMIGFNIFQLTKKGKLGIAHIERESLEDENDYYVKKIIDCEFDFVSIAKYHECMVFLYKYPMTERRCQVYLPDAGILTKECQEAYVSSRDIVVLRDEKHSEIRDTTTGKVLYEMAESVIDTRAYETRNYVVVVMEYFNGDDRNRVVMFSKLPKVIPLLENEIYDPFYYIITERCIEIDINKSEKGITDFEAEEYHRDVVKGFVLYSCENYDSSDYEILMLEDYDKLISFEKYHGVCDL